MKLAIFAFALCLACSCCFGEQVAELIKKEVHVLLQADPNLTVDHCTTKCDALFDLADSHDETHTDQLCHYYCGCTIHPAAAVCHGNHHTTQAPHHTRPHHTFFPHRTTRQN